MRETLSRFDTSAMEPEERESVERLRTDLSELLEKVDPDAAEQA